MQEHVIKQNISETLELNYMPYAMSVIVSRALPEIDGFKPSHRKLLYTMYKMGLLKSTRTKSANIVGQTMKLNPHGDSAIYETMVRLTKGYNALNTPFVDSKGNFGKVYSRDMAYAASRYTEAKLSDICESIFGDIEENCVEFVDNYDGKMKEPLLLPSMFPNILINSNQGIAVGMASNICGFNLGEVCDATIAYLTNEKIDITQHIKAPDFPTGGELIYNQNEMAQILETGKGSFKVRATYSIMKKENCIEITQIPYTTTIEAIIDKIEELVKSGKIREINDVRDETDLSGLKITIDLKRGVDSELLMQKLFKLTSLEDSFSCNFNILVKGRPQVMGVKTIIKEWYEFRKDCIIKKYNYNIDRLQKRQHLLLGLKLILLDIDKAIDIIRHTQKEKEVVPRLMSEFNLTELQADFVAEIKLRHLNQQYIENALKELDKLANDITKLQDTIASENKLKRVIRDELKRVKNSQDISRKTKLITIIEQHALPEHHFIDDYKLKIFLTNEQYFKKVSLSSLRNSGEQRLKDNDIIVQELETSNKTELIFFSDKAKVYKLKMYEIEDCKVSQLGTYLPNILGLDTDEKIIYVYPTINYEEMALVGFSNGRVSQIPLELYKTKTNRKKLINAYYTKADCIGIVVLQEDEVACAIRSDGRVVYFEPSQIEIKQKRDMQGDKVVNTTKKTEMTELYAVKKQEINFKTMNLPSNGTQPIS
ncbi:MAG: topoisomerase IV [Epulopiscium sp. Nele67-Bin001]|nr:MAG: topoisomerase IV [Epulopiscium sp. Nuni2H_MBin001]OON93575.1 MAG: topoisomerase IV [Epulopiscium sp. Nele67-Bin001]